VSGENGVVGLNDGSGDVRRWVNAEVEFALLAVVRRKAFQEERAETGASTSTNRVEDHKSLKASALIGELSNAVESNVNEFLAYGVVSSGVVVGGVFLSRDKLFWVEELLVLSGSDFVNDGRLQVYVNATRNVFSTAGFRKKGVGSVIDRLLSSELSFWSNTVFESEQLPAGVTHLRTSLSNVDRNDLAVRR